MASTQAESATKARVSPATPLPPQPLRQKKVRSYSKGHAERSLPIWLLVKLSLGMSSLILSIVILALWTTLAAGTRGGYWPNQLVVAWQTVEFVVMRAKHRTYGLRPLCTRWTAAAHLPARCPICIVVATFHVPGFWKDASGSYSYDKIEHALITRVLALLFFIHLYLFVHACVETNVRNRIGGAIRPCTD